MSYTGTERLLLCENNNNNKSIKKIILLHLKVALKNTKVLNIDIKLKQNYWLTEFD